ncbi:MAG TPA: hypothetical protein VIX84_22530 [Acidimicrobiales bacterium]
MRWEGREGRRRLQLGLPAGMLGLAALTLASCGGGPAQRATDTTTTHHGTTTTTAPGTTTTTAATATAPSLPPVSTSGPFQVSAPIEVPFSADRVTAAEGPDGAVFVAPQDPTSPSPAVAWVVDGNGPAVVAEHVNTGIAALAADGSNFYAATYSTVYAYDRASGNQDGQWSLPPVHPANSSDDDLVAMTAAAGNVYVSITSGNVVRVYRMVPGSSAAPQLVVTTLGAAIGSDGSVYYETQDHHLAVLRPGGATAVGAALSHAPNGLGGGVQYVNVVAGGAVWVSEPAGQGLDAGYSTYDVTTLGALGSFAGSVSASVVDTAAGPLVLEPAGTTNAACPQASPTAPSSCVYRIDVHGNVSDPAGVGAAVTLLGPGPAVVAADNSTDQFEVYRLS